MPGVKKAKKLTRANRAKRANNASTERLSQNLPKEVQGVTASTTSYAIQLAKASELTETDRESVYDLWEKNMKDLYMKSTSLPFKPAEKRQELFHTDSRFLLCRYGEAQGISAYTMFRFEFEEDELVVYWQVLSWHSSLRSAHRRLSSYELQVSAEHRRQGLGRSLMGMLLALRQQWSMEKVMLTVFKANESAVAFYKSTGFALDPTSPDWEDEEDYVLMSHEGAVLA